jgi:hypothetical protein
MPESVSNPTEAEIRARLEAIEWPWDVDAPSAGRPFEKIVVRNLGGGSQRSFIAQCGGPDDQAFIANAPTDIAYLLEQVASFKRNLVQMAEYLMEADIEDSLEILGLLARGHDLPNLGVAAPLPTEEKKAND